MQSRTSFEPMRSTLSMLSERNISKEIDDLLIKMRNNRDNDYSDALARIFLLKSVVDSRDNIQAFSEELTSYTKKRAKQQIDGKPFVFMSDLMLIIDNMLAPIGEYAVDKMEEMYGEMSLIEVETFNSLCGE